jgi:hypothetical protein
MDDGSMRIFDPEPLCRKALRRVDDLAAVAGYILSDGFEACGLGKQANVVHSFRPLPGYERDGVAVLTRAAEVQTPCALPSF